MGARYSGGRVSYHWSNSMLICAHWEVFPQSCVTSLHRSRMRALKNISSWWTSSTRSGAKRPELSSWRPIFCHSAMSSMSTRHGWRIVTNGFHVRKSAFNARVSLTAVKHIVECKVPERYLQSPHWLRNAAEINRREMRPK